MDETDLEERISYLEDRVSFLEQENGRSIEDYRFKNFIEMSVDEDAEVTYRDGMYGRFARIEGISPAKVDYIVRRVDSRDEFDFNIIEANNGIGMEVYTVE